MWGICTLIRWPVTVARRRHDDDEEEEEEGEEEDGKDHYGVG